MNQDRKIKLFSLLIALTIVITFFSYFGLFRYIKLHIVSSEKFIRDYNKLPRASKDKVVISFTTTPDKIEKIRPMLNSILDQTVKVDQIALNIPYKYNGKSYVIPREYKDIANIYRTEKGYGKEAAYIPTLLREGESDTKIIYLDDDKVYGKNLIASLVEASNKNPEKAIYIKDLMNHSVGVLVKPKFYGSDILNHTKEKSSINQSRYNMKVGKVKIKTSETYKSFMI